MTERGSQRRGFQAGVLAAGVGAALVGWCRSGHRSADDAADAPAAQFGRSSRYQASCPKDVAGQSESRCRQGCRCAPAPAPPAAPGPVRRGAFRPPCNAAPLPRLLPHRLSPERSPAPATVAPGVDSGREPRLQPAGRSIRAALYAAQAYITSYLVNTSGSARWWATISTPSTTSPRSPTPMWTRSGSPSAAASGLVHFFYSVAELDLSGSPNSCCPSRTWATAT